VFASLVLGAVDGRAGFVVGRSVERELVVDEAVVALATGRGLAVVAAGLLADSR
jgi:hypothetical protein